MPTAHSYIQSMLIHNYTAYINVPELQAAYYLGGYETKQTTSSITDDTKSYATGMIQYNTTTMEYTLLEAPFTPVQQGALVYLPSRDKGALVFLGGEVPASKSSVDPEITTVRLSGLRCSLRANKPRTRGITSRSTILKRACGITKRPQATWHVEPNSAHRSCMNPRQSHFKSTL